MTPAPADLKRLQSCLNVHRRRAANLGLPADDVRIADLIAKSAVGLYGNLLCYATGRVLDFRPESVGTDNKATIGHAFPLSSKATKHHPGHVLGNIELESWLHNQRQNNEHDTPQIARGKRHEVVKGRPRSGKIAQPKQAWGNPKLKRTISGEVVKR